MSIINQAFIYGQELLRKPDNIKHTNNLILTAPEILSDEYISNGYKNSAEMKWFSASLGTAGNYDTLAAQENNNATLYYPNPCFILQMDGGIDAPLTRVLLEGTTISEVRFRKLVRVGHNDTAILPVSTEYKYTGVKIISVTPEYNTNFILVSISYQGLEWSHKTFDVYGNAAGEKRYEVSLPSNATGHGGILAGAAA